MTKEIILLLVAFIALLVLIDSRKRGAKKSRPSSVTLDPLPSADEVGPTQSGRFRAMKVKAEIQKARQLGKKDDPVKKATPGAPREDLPDPFNVELQDNE